MCDLRLGFVNQGECPDFYTQALSLIFAINFVEFKSYHDCQRWIVLKETLDIKIEDDC
jgi:hypothetical protein